MGSVLILRKEEILMVEDGFMTVELFKNDVLLESYSTTNRSNFRKMVEEFSKRIVPEFVSKDLVDECDNDKYTIHMFTY